jgi:hypothetical protein
MVSVRHAGRKPDSPPVPGDLSYFVIVNLGVGIVFHPLKEARDHMVNTNCASTPRLVCPIWFGRGNNIVSLQVEARILSM